MRTFIVLCILVTFANAVWIQTGNTIIGAKQGDQFGYSVATTANGRTIAAGANYQDPIDFNEGRVIVYDYDCESDSWAPRGQPIDGPSRGDTSGYSVDLTRDGQFVAIGAWMGDAGGGGSGEVSVYEYQTDSWVLRGNGTHAANLFTDGQIPGPTSMDRAGHSVSIRMYSPDGGVTFSPRVAVGAPYHTENGGGVVQVYDLTEHDYWQTTQPQFIYGTPADGRSGWDVSLSNDGTILGIGNPGGVTPGKKAVVLKYDTSGVNHSWVQLGEDLLGEPDDSFGRALSVANVEQGGVLVPTIAVGAYALRYVEVYTFDGSQWTLKGQRINCPDCADAGEKFGYSVKLSPSGDMVGISAYGQSHAYVYDFNVNENKWIQRGAIMKGDSGSRFGWDMSMSDDGRTVVGGGYYANNRQGIVKVFQDYCVYGSNVMHGPGI